MDMGWGKKKTILREGSTMKGTYMHGTPFLNSSANHSTMSKEEREKGGKKGKEGGK